MPCPKHKNKTCCMWECTPNCGKNPCTNEILIASKKKPNNNEARLLRAKYETKLMRR